MCYGYSYRFALAVAETISFSSGSFTAGTIDQPGTNHLVVTQASGGGFNISSENNNAIFNLGIQGDNQSQDISFFSDTPVTLKGLTANLGGGADSLFIGGKTRGSTINADRGSDSVETEGAINNTDLNTGRGRDDVTLESDSTFVAVNSQIDMGQGNDNLVFGGAIKDTEINLGTGADTVEFTGNIRGANLNLGGDGDADTIRIAAGTNIEDLVITGADNNDRLFIGSTRYNYDSNSNLWVNPSNPDDTRNFS